MPSTFDEQNERDVESEEKQNEHYEFYEPEQQEKQCEAYDQAWEIESLENPVNIGGEKNFVIHRYQQEGKKACNRAAPRSKRQKNDQQMISPPCYVPMRICIHQRINNIFDQYADNEDLNSK
ncbi:hypothetical protein [Parasitella parasitica]|uniref:Uncharacterized protein n=1 Tax=Parasitella parasitica TaxID=35722 RepID=A0A0B7N7U8_9FUNG|nr:hypothetical protein [Parasitella parasitica]